MIRLTRNLFLFVIGVLTAAALKAEVSPVCFKDTVLINGRILSIKSSVQVDTLSPQPERTPFRKWLNDAQFYSAIRMGEEIGGEPEIGDGFFRVLEKTTFPEISVEVTHPVNESFQLFYKTGANVSLVNLLNYNKLDEDVIGFNWDESDDLLQIISFEDPLLNESDTLQVPLRNAVNMSVIAGLEWRGVMRGARGWVWGGQIEWSPFKPKRAHLLEPPSDPADWEEVPIESTYEIKPGETNAIKFRAYTSWSPWRTPLFLRAEVLISIDSASACLGIGYLW
ncbi:hypothetical protein N9C00_00250 [Flavobacteriales bacterium]|nr:hypothetical protein [Flavobacteriales bacterium]